MQWKTNSKWVDVETGEEIEEAEARKNYIIIKKESRSITTKTNGIREIINLCKKSNQIKLF